MIQRQSELWQNFYILCNTKDKTEMFKYNWNSFTSRFPPVSELAPSRTAQSWHCVSPHKNQLLNTEESTSTSWCLTHTCRASYATRCLAHSGDMEGSVCDWFHGRFSSKRWLWWVKIVLSLHSHCVKKAYCAFQYRGYNASCSINLNYIPVLQKIQEIQGLK